MRCASLWAGGQVKTMTLDKWATPTLGPFVVEPFGDKVSDFLPFAVTDTNGNIVAYTWTEANACLIVKMQDCLEELVGEINSLLAVQPDQHSLAIAGRKARILLDKVEGK